MRLLSIVTLAALALAAPARAAVNVMASTEDLADLTRQVGGDKVKVESIARGYQDPHFVEAKPSFILKLAKADLLVVVGRELEIGWLPPPHPAEPQMAKGPARRRGLPRRSLTGEDSRDPDRPDQLRAMGRTCHPQATHHYWLDPGQRPPHREGDRGQALRRWDAATAAVPSSHATPTSTSGSPRPEKRWDAQMVPYKASRIVTYHRSWPNFTDRFGPRSDRVRRAAARASRPPEPHARPDPGNEDAEGRDHAGRALLRPQDPNAIARETGAKVVVHAPSVGGEEGDHGLPQAVRLRRRSWSSRAIKETGSK
jgi:zinc/manganese transport system substrate-binding protein